MNDIQFQESPLKFLAEQNKLIIENLTALNVRVDTFNSHKTLPEWLSRKQMAKVENISISMVDKLSARGDRYEIRKMGRKTLLRIKKK